LNMQASAATACLRQRRRGATQRWLLHWAGLGTDVPRGRADAIGSDWL